MRIVSRPAIKDGSASGLESEHLKIKKQKKGHTEKLKVFFIRAAALSGREKERKEELSRNLNLLYFSTCRSVGVTCGGVVVVLSCPRAQRLNVMGFCVLFAVAFIPK